MKLRELINLLEEFSENGENDAMEVVYNDVYDYVTFRGALIRTDLNKIELL